MLKLFSFNRSSLPRAQFGVLLTYFASEFLLAVGVSFAFWVEMQLALIWAWLLFFSLCLTLEAWVLWKPRSHGSLELITSGLVGFMWAIPMGLWFGRASADAQLLLAAFLALVALCGVLLKQNGPVRSLLNVGIALPLIYFILWQSNDQTANYASLAVLAGWLIALCLGWLIGWSSDERRQFLVERELLLTKLEAKMIELDNARANEKEARALADQANTDKSKFLAMISHDLRQPIYAANLMLETAQQGDEARISQKDLSHIQNSLSDLAGYLETLLDTAMLDSGEIRANPTIFSLRDLAGQLQAEFQEMAAMHEMSLQIEMPPLSVLSDQILLSRILRNLIANAVYHSGGTSLKIFHSEERGLISISIEDDGKGLPSDIQAWFNSEPQSASPVSDNSRNKHRGLGLSIVRRLCDLLGVSIQSTQLSEGTKFEISALKIASSLDAAAPPVKRKHWHEGKAIVVIDDDAAILDNLTDLLKRWGYVVHGSPRNLPDVTIAHLIIADFDLAAEQDGVDLIEKARARWGEALPAFVISGSTSSSVAARVHAAGIRLVPKPIRPAVLKSIILTELS